LPAAPDEGETGETRSEQQQARRFRYRRASRREVGRRRGEDARIGVGAPDMRAVRKQESPRVVRRAHRSLGKKRDRVASAVQYVDAARDAATRIAAGDRDEQISCVGSEVGLGKNHLAITELAEAERDSGKEAESAGGAEILPETASLISRSPPMVPNPAGTKTKPNGETPSGEFRRARRKRSGPC